MRIYTYINLQTYMCMCANTYVYVNCLPLSRRQAQARALRIPDCTDFSLPKRLNDIHLNCQQFPTRWRKSLDTRVKKNDHNCKLKRRVTARARAQRVSGGARNLKALIMFARRSVHAVSLSAASSGSAAHLIFNGFQSISGIELSFLSGFCLSDDDRPLAAHG